MLGVILATLPFTLSGGARSAPESSSAELLLVGRWTQRDVEDLHAGFATLPEKLFPLPGGPLELELHPEPRPFGIGGWTDGHRRLHLYAIPAHVEGERRAQWRLEGLSTRERERAWRMRAAVHAALTRWDDYLKLSQRPEWRRLDGWLQPLERPLTFSERALNLSHGAYSRSAGERSAALDLATFAEELFVPVDAVGVDDRIRCQEFSKTRVLLSLLHEAGLTEAPRAPSCPAFDRWADLQHLSHLEVLLVQASGRKPESLFGHVLMRPVYADAEKVRGPSFDTAIQLAAVTEQFPGLMHLVHGVFGGYRLSVLTLSLRDVEREMLEQEQRSMRRFRLKLSPEQNRRVLERTWELERRGSFDYQFFTDNCGSALAWLLEGAIGEAIPRRGAVLVSPGATVDDLAAAGLLERVPRDFESTCERARRADARRAELETDIVRSERFPDSAALRSADPTERERARTAAAAYTRAHPSPEAYEWWALTVRVEQCSADLAERRLKELDLNRVQNREEVKLDLEAEVQEREALFERESELQRHLMMMDRAERARELLASLPRRALTASETEDVARDEALVAAYDRLLDQHASLVREQFPTADPHALLASDARALEAQVEQREAESLPASGHWRVRAGAGAWVTGSTAAPLVFLSSSGLAEELGDQRSRGFQPGVSLHVLDGEAWMKLKVGLPEVAWSRFTLFGIRSLIQSPAWARDTPLPDLGFGAEIFTDTRAGRALENRTGLQGELLGVAGHGERFRGHLAFGLGLSGVVSWGDAAPGLAGSVYATLVARTPLPGHASNGLRAEGRYALFARTSGRTLWLEELTVQAGAEVKAGPVIIGPRLTFAVQRELGQFTAPTFGAVIAFERAAPL